MKILSKDKMDKMKNVKKNILEQRPVGAGSCIGESFNNYTSPVKLGGSTSLMHSPKNRLEGPGGSSAPRINKKF